MKTSIESNTKSLQITKKGKITGLILLAFLVVLAISIASVSKPKRSITEYCKVYKSEKDRLSKLTGDTYPSAVFNMNLGDAGEFVKAFSRMEVVAPDEIKSDVTTLRSVYEDMNTNPSNLITASINGLDSESKLDLFTKTNCSVR